MGAAHFKKNAQPILFIPPSFNDVAESDKCLKFKWTPGAHDYWKIGSEYNNSPVVLYVDPAEKWLAPPAKWKERRIH